MAADAGRAIGKLLDRCYKLTAKHNKLVIDTTVGDDMKIFPIQEARTQLAYVMDDMGIGEWSFTL